MINLQFDDPTIREFVSMVELDCDSLYTKLPWGFIYDELRKVEPDCCQFEVPLLIKDHINQGTLMKNSIIFERVDDTQFIQDNWIVIYGEYEENE